MPIPNRLAKLKIFLFYTLPSPNRSPFFPLAGKKTSPHHPLHHPYVLDAVQKSGLAANTQAGMPKLPATGPDGNYPALEYAQASLARDIIGTRRRLGLSQAELARRAGIPPESLNRVERAKTNPTIKTVDKIDRALRAAEQGQMAGTSAR